MCGRKPCRACAAAKKGRISGTKKRKTMAKRANSRNLTGQLTNVALAGVGYVVSDQLNKIPFLATNPNLVNAAKLGIGTYLAMSSRNPMMVSIGQGAALNGAIGFGRQFGVVQGIGQISLPYGGNSKAIPGVAGNVIVR